MSNAGRKPFKADRWRFQLDRRGVTVYQDIGTPLADIIDAVATRSQMQTGDGRAKVKEILAFYHEEVAGYICRGRIVRVRGFGVYAPHLNFPRDSETGLLGDPTFHIKFRVNKQLSNVLRQVLTKVLVSEGIMGRIKKMASEGKRRLYRVVDHVW